MYLVAGAAFRNMVRQNTSQSLVINGESGAGKTETTKKAMQFLAALAGSQKRDHDTPVEKQVLEVSRQRHCSWDGVGGSSCGSSQSSSSSSGIGMLAG